MNTLSQIGKQHYLLATTENFHVDGIPRIIVLYKFNGHEATIIDIKVEKMPS